MAGIFKTGIASILVFIFIALAGCSPKNGTLGDGSKWIPADFDPANTVLLIENHPLGAKQTAKMVEFLKNKYPYKFELASKGAIENAANHFEDTKVYRFGVEWEMSSHRTGANDLVYDLFGHFVDRTNNKSYPTTKRGLNYGQLGYVPFINTIIKGK